MFGLFDYARMVQVMNGMFPKRGPFWLAVHCRRRGKRKGWQRGR